MSVQSFLLLILIFLCASCKPLIYQEKDLTKQDLAIIDTHIHLYDTGRTEGVDWPPVKDKVLYRPVLTEHFDEVAVNEGITSTVVVEASSRVEDNQWVLDLVKDNPDRYLGVVGNLPIGTDEFSNLLDRFAKDSRFVGIRMRDRPGKDAFFTDKVWRDLSLLAQKGLTLDVLIHHFSIEDVIMVAKRLPELKIMINHLTGLVITKESLDPLWMEPVKQVADHKNVYCKVSGIFQRSGVSPSPKDRSFYAPVFKFIYESFGEDRIVYGSNWPVTDRGGSYFEQFNIIRGYFKNDSIFQSDREKQVRIENKLFRENAVRFYGLD